MRISVYRRGDNLNRPAAEHVSKSTAKRWELSGLFVFIRKNAIKEADHAKKEQAIATLRIQYLPIFQYDYPAQFAHPELLNQASHRYPMQLAPNHRAIRRVRHAG